MNRSLVKASGVSLVRFVLLLCCALLSSCETHKSPAGLRRSRPRSKAQAKLSRKRTPRHTLAASSSKNVKRAPVPPHSSEKTKLAGATLPTGAPSMDSDTATSSTRPAKKNVIEVVLTFDDGPHAAPSPPGRGKNYTQKVSQTLKNNILQKNIKAVFFVQTHAPGRGATPVGQDIIAMLAREGHVIGIHTGSTRDHASHCTRARAPRYDANRNGVLDAADGANGLESDMVRAKARIRKLTGSESLYVRPTYGERNRTVRAVYRRQHLKMILWDIDSGDNSGASVDVVNLNIHKGMRRCVAAGKEEMVILFHDINSTTARNLEEYLGNICISARKLGKTVVFPTTTERVIRILNAKTYQ